MGPYNPPRMGLTRGQFQAIVKENIPLCREHYRLVLFVDRLDHFPVTDPGQFVQVACRDLGEDFNSEHEFDWCAGERPVLRGHETLSSSLAMLRRPFSLAGRRDVADGVELDIIHRVVGVGTDWMSRLRAGDSVFVLGPLGNRFELPPADAEALMVGGGVGIPPMLYLAERLVGKKAVAFAGALCRDLLPLTITDDGGQRAPDDAEPHFRIAEFAKYGIPSVITTDDGSFGYRGFVTQALEAYLDKAGFGVQEMPNIAASNQSRKGAPVIYTCGPEPMMKRVADIAQRRRLPCQIAVERAMACGMGTCQSCCIKVKKPDPNQPPLVGKDWACRLACTDGPVFPGADLLW